MEESPAVTPSDSATTLPKLLPTWILVGDKSLAKDKLALQRSRVKYILNVTPTLANGGVANYFPSDPTFEYCRLEVRDVATENILPSVPAAVEFLQRARVRADGRALIHCNEGKSRSAAIVASFLISAYGMSVEEALGAVRAARPQAQPRDAFVKQLRSLEPTKLPSEIDGYVDAAPTTGPALKRPAVGPTARPALGPASGASASGEECAPKRGPIGPEPPPKRAAIGPSLGPSASPRPRASAPTIGPMGPPGKG